VTSEQSGYPVAARTVSGGCGDNFRFLHNRHGSTHPNRAATRLHHRNHEILIFRERGSSFRCGCCANRHGSRVLTGPHMCRPGCLASARYGNPPCVCVCVRFYFRCKAESSLPQRDSADMTDGAEVTLTRKPRWYNVTWLSPPITVRSVSRKAIKAELKP